MRFELLALALQPPEMSFGKHTPPLSTACVTQRCSVAGAQMPPRAAQSAALQGPAHTPHTQLSAPLQLELASQRSQLVLLSTLTSGSEWQAPSAAASSNLPPQLRASRALTFRPPVA